MPLSGDARDTSMYGLGALSEIFVMGQQLHVQGSRAALYVLSHQLQQKQQAQEAQGSPQAQESQVLVQGTLGTLALSLSLVKFLREHMRVIIISTETERLARAVDSYLEDVDAGLQAAIDLDQARLLTAEASRAESQRMAQAAVDELGSRLMG